MTSSGHPAATTANANCNCWVTQSQTIFFESNLILSLDTNQKKLPFCSPAKECAITRPGKSIPWKVCTIWKFGITLLILGLILLLNYTLIFSFVQSQPLWLLSHTLEALRLFLCYYYIFWNWWMKLVCPSNWEIKEVFGLILLFN